MSSLKHERPSAALVISCIALFVALSGSAIAITKGEVGSKQIAKKAVKAKHVAKKAIKAKHLAKNSVKPKQILDGGVRAAEIRNGSVLSDKLADGAVSADKLADGAVFGDALAGGAVVTSKVADGAITAAKMADGVIPDGATGAAGGDLAGSYPNPAIAPDAVGVAQVAVNVNGTTGEVRSYFNRLGGEPTAIRHSAGRYQIVIPGLNANDVVAANLIHTATPSADNLPRSASVYKYNPGGPGVRINDENGTATDTNFIYILYGVFGT